MEYQTGDIRNVAFTGHAGAGKTTLLESMLAQAGAIKSAGAVEKGTTVCDYDELEKKHGHSLVATLAGFDYQDTHINLLDTPGYPDFVGAALSVLPAVETVAVVINAQQGVESTSRRMMDWAREQEQCRMVIINRIDAEDIDLEVVYAQVREIFGKECLAVNLPSAGGAEALDCFFKAEGESSFSSVDEAHTAIVDQAVEIDDDLMTLYLDQGEVSADQLHSAFEQAMREGHLVPVCFTSAHSGAGVPELLDFFVRLLPNPSEGNPPHFLNGHGDDAQPVAVSPDPAQHALAHVFKVSFDPFVGRQALFRLHQGTVRKDGQLFVGDARKPRKVGTLMVPFGKEGAERTCAVPGDIVQVSKVEGLSYDDVLHDSHDEDLIYLQPLPLPAPMVGVSISPKSRGDEQKIADVLARLTVADPCLRVERDPVANETVLRGMGDLHLRVTVERMAEQYGVQITTKVPTIPYRETIAKPAEGHCRHKKQTGGAGQFGEVFLKVEPLPRGSGFEFVNKIVGGVIPAQFIPAVEKGVQSVLDGGAVAGFPMQDLRVTVYDGKHHAVDSKEVAFVAAGRKAFLDAVGKAKPAILEPVVNLEVVVPEGNMGDITGDLSSRRGRVMSTDALPGSRLSIRGQVPLAEMRDYQSRVKSMTGGEGHYTMEFADYEPAPGEDQKRLIAAFQQPAEE
ncbi:MAG: elongation factor G [Arenicellales bacterium]|nr:elongation factor G [Arenicellales bacterium]